MLPVFGQLALLPRRDEPLGALAGLDRNVWLRSGRAALGVALAQLQGLAGARVLVPAYHCQSMVDPVVAAGARPDFYALSPRLDPDPDAIERRLPGARAIVCTHFFGQIHDFGDIRRACDRHGVALIEDCAHALFGAVGRAGDDVISSLRKFYPVFDGATIGSSRHDLSAVRVSPPGTRYQLKAVKNSIEIALRHRRPHATPAAAPVFDADATTASGADTTYTDPRFDPRHYAAGVSALTRWSLKRVDVAQMKHARRRNFARLVRAIDDLRHMSPWLRGQPADAVPYVVPLLLERPETDFAALKTRGMPIWRWDALASDGCPVSERYRLSLLQLPCHQGLGDDETDRMIGWLNEVDAA